MSEKAKVDVEKWVNCLGCQLICSLTFTQRFNLEDAGFIVQPIMGGRG